MSRYLIIDTETTGLNNLPPYFKTNLYDNCRLVQLTMLLFDSNFNKELLEDYIINTENRFNIPNSEFHGISNEISLARGSSFEQIANRLSDIMDKTTHIIAHNSDFDTSVLKSELYRINRLDIIEKIKSKEVYCSMKLTKNIVNATNKYGVKYPSLAELYRFTFGKEIQNAHNSKYDVLNLYDILKSLHDRNILCIVNKSC